MPKAQAQLLSRSDPMPKAIRIHEHGGPSVMKWEEHEPGAPGSGQALKNRSTVDPSLLLPRSRHGPGRRRKVSRQPVSRHRRLLRPSSLRVSVPRVALRRAGRSVGFGQRDGGRECRALFATNTSCLRENGYRAACKPRRRRHSTNRYVSGATRLPLAGGEILPTVSSPSTRRSRLRRSRVRSGPVRRPQSS